MRQLIPQFLKPFRGWRLVVVIYLALFIPLFRPVMSFSDPVGYYSWARSLLIDGDLNVANEFLYYEMGKMPVTATGYTHNQWAAGSSLLWLPGMLAAHVSVSALEPLGIPIVADGYSWPYLGAASLTSTVAGLGAVLISYHLARKLFGGFAALLASVVIWLASPLVFYQYHQPLMSHANDACLGALFVWVWWTARDHDFSPRWMLLLGVIIGVAVWVRPQNAILLLAVLLESAFDLALTIRRGVGKAGAGRAFRRIMPLSMGFAVLFLPLMLFWHEVYGAWLVNSYQAVGGGDFDWRASHVWEVLLSTNRGLFVWTPVALFSVIGVRWLFQVDRRLTRLLCSIALLHLFVISSWSVWYGGHAFGPRFWVALTPFFASSLAALVNHLDGTLRAPRSLLLGLGSAFVVWNFLLMLQYSTGLVAPTGPVDLGALIRNQFAVTPKMLEQLVRRLQFMMNS